MVSPELKVRAVHSIGFTVPQDSIKTVSAEVGSRVAVRRLVPAIKHQTAQFLLKVDGLATQKITALLKAGFFLELSRISARIL